MICGSDLPSSWGQCNWNDEKKRNSILDRFRLRLRSTKIRSKTTQSGSYDKQYSSRHKYQCYNHWLGWYFNVWFWAGKFDGFWLSKRWFLSCLVTLSKSNQITHQSHLIFDIFPSKNHQIDTRFGFHIKFPLIWHQDCQIWLD